MKTLTQNELNEIAQYLKTITYLEEQSSQTSLGEICVFDSNGEILGHLQDRPSEGGWIFLPAPA